MLTNSQLGDMLKNCKKHGAIDNETLRCVESFIRSKFATAIYVRQNDKDDIVQGVMLRFWRTWKLISPSRKPAAYLAKMVKTEIYRYNRLHRKRKVIMDYESEIENVSPNYCSVLDTFGRIDRTQKRVLRRITTRRRCSLRGSSL